MPFFPASRLLNKAPVSLVPKCGACGLFKTCKSPKMLPSGKGRRRFLILGEAPGADEDDEGAAFVGRAGRHLENALRKVGVDLRRDCTITNSLICRPPNNATPTSEQIDYCRPNLIKTLDEFKPDVIIPLGASAVQSLLTTIFKDKDIGGITRWAGFNIPCQRVNAWVCPTFHPSHLLRSEEDPVLELMFHEHLKRAAEHDSKPWDRVPDYKRDVEKIFKPREAAKLIREFIKRGGWLAFDYETTRLKPEWPDAQIVSCSVCWRGKRTIAYPWLGEAIDATWELVRSRNPKIASNIKFEDRWTRWFFGKGVRNWRWCTMTNAHLIDNRERITSIKFQAFVLLGAESYDDHIKPFLRAKKGEKLNRILSEIDMGQLLLYNGLDSLLEYKVAMLQMEIMGYDRNNYKA